MDLLMQNLGSELFNLITETGPGHQTDVLFKKH